MRNATGKINYSALLKIFKRLLKDCLTLNASD